MFFKNLYKEEHMSDHYIVIITLKMKNCALCVMFCFVYPELPHMKKKLFTILPKNPGFLGAMQVLAGLTNATNEHRSIFNMGWIFFSGGFQ